jgi:TonB family protein
MNVRLTREGRFAYCSVRSLSRRQGFQMRALRITTFLLVTLSPLANSYGQESSSSEPSKDKTPVNATLTFAQLEGFWLKLPVSILEVKTFEFSHDGRCGYNNFGEASGKYERVGDSLTIGAESTSAAIKLLPPVWKVRVDGGSLTLQMFSDLPACSFYRTDSSGAASDPLIGSWKSNACDIPATAPNSSLWKALVSNAVYTFTAEGKIHLRYTLLQVFPYSIQNNGISFPVSGAKDFHYSFTVESGTPTLTGENHGPVFIKQTPAEILAWQYMPGDQSEEVIRRGNDAIAAFKAELAKDPNNVTAIDNIGALLFRMAGQPFDSKKFEESKSYFQRHIQLKPPDPQPYYWVGVIDWTLAYRGNVEMRLQYNVDAYARNNLKSQVKDMDPLPPAVRADYVSKYGAIVKEGITDLERAILLRPNYDDAMAYLNLLYRRKADMVETEADRASFEKRANDLVEKIKAIKQANAAAGNQPTVTSLLTPPPPPPPPPPPSLPQATTIGGIIAPQSVQVGGAIQAAKIVSKVNPTYPPLARQTHISGTVRLHAIIGKDGSVQQLEVISGHPLLLQSALDAVYQWRYQPTLLNGEPVEVDTTIDVIFSLNP